MTEMTENPHLPAVVLISPDAELAQRIEQALDGTADVAKLMRVDRVDEALALLASVAPEAILLDLSAADQPVSSAVTELAENAPVIALASSQPGHRPEESSLARQGGALDVLDRDQAVGSLVRQAVLHAVRHTQNRRQIERLEEQLFHAQKMESLGLVSGGVAHDFNNLLVAILGHADVALRDPDDRSRVTSCLEGIKKASIRASDLAAQLLSYTGKNEFELHPCSLNRIIEEMTQLLHASIPRKVELQLALADDLPGVDMDPTQIRQVVLNLITNAAESIGDEPGTVCVQTGLTIAPTPEGDTGDRPCVELTISDTGCGMDEQTLGQIYEPFFSTKVDGRGLGMAAVQGIIARHRGTLTAESTPGEGTTFRIALPAGTRQAAEKPAEPAGHVPSPSSKTCRTVLVIDDEEDVREILQMMLESTGLVVLSAADGPEGIETFRRQRNHIAAILLDMTMPQMDGTEVLREIRKIDPDVPVLLCSGYGPQNARGRLPLDQIAGFIAKPFEMDALLENVFSVIEKSSPCGETPCDCSTDESGAQSTRSVG